MKLHKIAQLLLLAGILTGVSGCGGGEGSQKEDTEVSAMKNEVMRIHDEVMPKMGKLKSLESKLAAMTEDSTAQALATEVGEAHAAMMLWMKNYKAPDASTEKAKALEYLNEQEKEITEVKEAINSSITAAESLLEGK